MYHILSIITLASFIIWGRYYRDTKKINYWLSALIPILIYSLSYGLRDGWGVDFEHYKDIFEHLRDTDPCLYALNYLINSLGFSSTFAFIIYSVILSCGFFYIVKGYKNEATYILPLLWVCSTEACGLIRYWIAIGWLLIALYFYLQQSYYKSIILFMIAVGTHTSVILFLPIVLICNWKDYFKKRWVLMSIFIVFTVLFDKEMLGEKIVMPAVDFLSKYINNERLNMYNDDAEFWLSGSRITMIAQTETNEIINRIRMGLTHGIILYLGFSVKNRYKNGVIIFNLMAVGLILYNTVQGFELVNRYIETLRMFLAFILGFIIAEQRKYTLINNKLIFWSLIVFCYINLFYRAFLGTQTLLMYNRYIWD